MHERHGRPKKVQRKVAGELATVLDEVKAFRNWKDGAVPLETSAQLASAVLDRKNARRLALGFGLFTPLSVVGTALFSLPFVSTASIDLLQGMEATGGLSTFARAFENVPTYATGGLALTAACMTGAVATVAIRNLAVWVKSNDNWFTKSKGLLSVAQQEVQQADRTQENTLLRQFNRQQRWTHYDWIGTAFSISLGVGVHFIPFFAPFAPVVALMGSAAWEIGTEFGHQFGNFFLYRESRKTLNDAWIKRNQERGPISWGKFRQEVREQLERRRNEINRTRRGR